MINGIDRYENVTGFTENEINEMCIFLQGAVYCWCKNRKDEWFAARDLLGGDNFNWEGTPLYSLFRYYFGDNNDNYDYAVGEAGKAAGRLLKRVLHNDRRIFDTEDGRVRKYRWTGED